MPKDFDTVKTETVGQPPKGRWLTVDPGEDTGWSMWNGDRLLGAGTDKMFSFADDVWAALAVERGLMNAGVIDAGQLGEGEQVWLREGVEPEANTGSLGLIVCEDFRIYPWKAKELAWDQVRTARLIGALYFMARTFHIPFVLQGAKIKERAVVGGAEELFYTPLHENRHQNDAIMHGWFYVQTVIRGIAVDPVEESPPDA